MPDNKIYDQKEILLQIADGDEDAFSSFFLANVTKLKSLLSRYTRRPVDTEEIIQDTFIKLWLNRDALPAIENIEAYIYKVAINSYRMRLRSEIAARKREQNWSDNYMPENDISSLSQSRLYEMQQVVNIAVQNLSQQRRLIYTLSREEGLSIPEIAARLNLSANTVKNTLVTSLSIIRQHLTDNGYSFTLACIYLFF